MDNKNIGVILHPSFPHSSSLSISKMSVQLLLIFPGSGCFSTPPLSPCWSRLNIYQFPYKFLCSFSCPSQSFSHTKARVIFFFFFSKFIYFWLLWVFTEAHKLSLVAASGKLLKLWCAGFLLQCILLLWNTDSRHVGSVVVAHGLQNTTLTVVVHELSYPEACTPGMKLVSPALHGRFLTTGPSGTPLKCSF